MSDLLDHNTTTTTTPTGGSFPSTSSVASSGDLVNQLSHMTPAEFFAEYQISSTEQPMYVTTVNGTLTLNQNALDLASYYQMSQADRQQLEQGLVDAGLLKQADATGVMSSTGTDAFKTAISQASQQGLSVTSYLNQQSGGGLGPIEEQISGNITEAQNELNKQTPVVATLENPTTLNADLTNAFDQTLGYAPNQGQEAAFTSGIQGQDVALAQGANEATRAQAQADLQRDQGQQAALQALGKDGIDTFLSAYAAAIRGTGVPGAGTTTGPATGSQPVNPRDNGYLQPGSRLPANSTAFFNPNGTEMVANTTPTFQTKTETYSPGLFQEAGRMISQNSFAPSLPTRQVTTGTMRPGMETAPFLPAGEANSTPIHGGIYALSPVLWEQAQKLYPGAKQYATPGQAPQAVQQAAVTALAQNMYDTAGNWTDVAVELAGGSPGKSGTVLNKPGSNIQSFANGVAQEVNNQIAALQAQVNAPGPEVTTKVTAPDANAEANLAAKEADPVGYYAANYASANSLLSKMLYGSPLNMIQSTADTFTGPVESATAGSSGGAVA